MDVCVLPSLTESFCKARLDAFLCGVPVITTAVGFGREIIGEDGERGWIVTSSDAQALAAVLKRTTHLPKIGHLSAHAAGNTPSVSPWRSGQNH